MENEVSSNLKTILADGKKSTFSLTSLFDSKTFNDEDKIPDAHKESFKEKKELNLEFKPNDLEKILKIENKIKENFFFSDNDSRFETVKFFDTNKRENFIKDWIKHKDFLIQALAKRRRFLKKKLVNENKQANVKNDKNKYKKMRHDNDNKSKNDNKTKDSNKIKAD